LSDLPSIETIVELLEAHWQIEPDSVSAWPKSARLFRVEGYGFARIGFPRGGLTAAELVELVDTLHASGCAVPDIVPTSTGALSILLADTTLSVEQFVSGVECSDTNLDILPQVGREVGRIHAATYENKTVPGCVGTLGEWIDETLAKAQTLAVEWNHGDPMHVFGSTIRAEFRDLKSRFGLTHGDVRSANVLAEGDTVGFVDFNCKFEPQLCDVVKIRNKWLMSPNLIDERPLTSSEIAGFLGGYHETRPLTADEVTAFPVIWALEQSWRLSQELGVVSMFPPKRAANWPISQQIGDLPQATQLGLEILQTASLCSRV